MKIQDINEIDDLLFSYEDIAQKLGIEIGKMKLFALGNPTSKILREYSINQIIKPKYPDIYTLSDLIYSASISEEK